MSDYLQKIMEKIRNLAKSVEDYTKEAITPALPSVAGVNLAKKLISQEKYEEAKTFYLENIVHSKDNVDYPARRLVPGIIFQRCRTYKLSIFRS